MKIVQVLGWYYPESLGGTEVYVSSLVENLQGLGHEVLVAAPDASARRERTYAHQGAQVFRYPVPMNPTRAECQGVARVRGTEHLHDWLRQSRPDVVHFHTFVTGLGLEEVRLAKAIGARVVATTHSSSLGFICQRGTLMRWGEEACDGVRTPLECAACDLQSRGLGRTAAWGASRLSRLAGKAGHRVPGRVGTALGAWWQIITNRQHQVELLTLVDKFVVLTKQAAEIVRENGAPAGKVLRIPLGVSGSGVGQALGAAMRPTRSPVRFGYLGRFEAIKGVCELATAVATIPKTLDFKIEFRGPATSRADLAVLGKAKHILDGDDRVEFADAVPHAEVRQVLASYDVLCCPSLCHEGGPTVALEAHAVGTPVIGSNIGGLAEIVADQANGRLVAPGDWKALASVIETIVRDPARTIDLWRRSIRPPRTMREVAADYAIVYEGRS